MHDSSLLPSQAGVLASDSQTTVWIVPTSSGQVCLALQPGDKYASLEDQRGMEHPQLGWVCNSPASVVAHGLAMNTYGDVIGLVPDGVTSVTTHIGDVTSSATVRDNLFRAHTDGSPFSGGTASYAVDATPVSMSLP
jgi:hypothetical protein